METFELVKKVAVLMTLVADVSYYSPGKVPRKNLKP